MSKKTKPAEKRGMESLMETLCRIRDPQEMRQFLTEILTPAEFHDLAMRWELMHRLTEGFPQRKIAADLQISLCKITRGAKILKNPHSISNQYLKKRRNQ
jgi:TrpR family trp operon transcriptional repressor